MYVNLLIELIIFVAYTLNNIEHVGGRDLSIPARACLFNRELFIVIKHVGTPPSTHYTEKLPTTKKTK